MAISLTPVNKKYRHLVVAIVIMVALLGLQPFMWSFVHRQALTLQQQRSQGQQIANVGTRNSEITGHLRTAGEFLSQLDVVAPPTTAKTQIVERIEQLADQLGAAIDITVIQELRATAAVAEKDPLVPLSVSVTVTGTVSQVLSFLDRVEHTQELSVVPNWTLTAAAAAPSPAPSALTQYTLSADIYFFLRHPDND